MMEADDVEAPAVNGGDDVFGEAFVPVGLAHPADPEQVGPAGTDGTDDEDGVTAMTVVTGEQDIDVTVMYDTEEVTSEELATVTVEFHGEDLALEDAVVVAKVGMMLELEPEDDIMVAGHGDPSVHEVIVEVVVSVSVYSMPENDATLVEKVKLDVGIALDDTDVEEDAEEEDDAVERTTDDDADDEVVAFTALMLVLVLMLLVLSVQLGFGHSTSAMTAPAKRAIVTKVKCILKI